MTTLSDNERLVIHILSSRGPMTLMELAAAMGKTLSCAYYNVARLRKRNVLLKPPHNQARGVALRSDIAISESGRVGRVVWVDK